MVTFNDPEFNRHGSVGPLLANVKAKVSEMYLELSTFNVVKAEKETAQNQAVF